MSRRFPHLHSDANGAQRRGAIIVEFLLALPVLFVATLAIFEFGMIGLLHQSVVVAATEGAREAAKGGNINDVASVVNQFLAPHNVVISSVAGSDGNLVLEDGDLASTTHLNADTASFPCFTPSSPTLGLGEVRVTVCVRLTDGMDEPVPNFLSKFGFSLVGKRLEVSGFAKKE